MTAGQDYKIAEKRNASLSPEDAASFQAMGFCTYPKCKCIVGTSTTKPSPDCPRKLEQYADVAYQLPARA